MLEIGALSKDDCLAARDLIVQGLSEYFREYDPQMNPDLLDLEKSYLHPEVTFLVGKISGEVVATAGLISESKQCGRIVRMSVSGKWRRHGIGRQILEELETLAQDKGMEKLVLETSRQWEQSKAFYLSCGYAMVAEDLSNIHFSKKIK